MEQAPKELEVFGTLQRTLAEATMQGVHGAVQEDWREAYLDLRSTPDGASRGMKLTVVLASGQMLALRPGRAIEAALHRICEMRTAFVPPWYGMRLAMTSAGNCEVRFSYEPACYDDPHFRDCLEF